MDGEKLAVEMLEALNTGINKREFAKGIQDGHNALQRGAFHSVFKAGIQALAATPYTDRRNEEVVRKAREICEAMDWDVEEYEPDM